MATLLQRKHIGKYVVELVETESWVKLRINGTTVDAGGYGSTKDLYDDLKTVGDINMLYVDRHLHVKPSR